MDKKTRSFFELPCKAIFTAIILLASSLAGNSQTISVAPLKMNVLYIGVDNPLSVAASTATDETVTVSIAGGGGTVSKVEAGLFNVRVTSQTDNCTVNVYSEGKLLGSTRFRVRLLPEPAGTIGGYSSGAYISADALRSQAGLGVYVQNSPFDIKYEVVGFSIILTDNKGNVISVPCKGSSFSETARQYMDRNLKPGDIVTIEKIIVKSADGTQIKLPGLLYNIK